MASLPQRDMHWVSWPGVCTCVVGGVLYLFSCVQNKQASQLEAAVPLEKLSGAPPAPSPCAFPVPVLLRVWCPLQAHAVVHTVQLCSRVGCKQRRASPLQPTPAAPDGAAQT